MLVLKLMQMLSALLGKVRLSKVPVAQSLCASCFKQHELSAQHPVIVIFLSYGMSYC